MGAQLVSAIPRLKGDAEPVVCGVCRRRATGLGQSPRQGAPVLWLCSNLECQSVSRKVYSMSERLLDAYEVQARAEAGQHAGEYLDTIGKTKLDDLSPEEWFTFLDKVLFGFEHSLRRRFVEGAAPF